MSAIALTNNFFLAEFLESDLAERAGIDNTPNSPLVMANLYKLAELMEQVRKLCKNSPVLISSGYRSPRLNALVGGSENSDHLRGEACDFRVPKFGTPGEVARAIAKSGIKFGQLIFEGSWVHISLPDGTKRDGEVLTAVFTFDADGKRKVSYKKGLGA